MGQVYRAADTRLDRAVAIKVMPAALADDPIRRERFEREARSISRLEHPNICPLYDVGELPPEVGGGLFLVMQFLEGESLAQRLSRGALSIKETLDVGIQIAEALAAAHRAGIVHRDLKPGNVMLTRAGARLLDFGLARNRVHGFAQRGDVGRRRQSHRADDAGHAARHAALHGARTTRRPRRGYARRHFRVRRGDVRDGHRTQGIRSRESRAGAERDSARRAGSRVDPGAGDAGRPRRIDSYLPRQGSERAMAGHGRRGPPAAMVAERLEQRQVRIDGQARSGSRRRARIDGGRSRRR